jgi:hypothetical protein
LRGQMHDGGGISACLRGDARLSEGRLLLDVVVAESTAIFKLLSSEGKTLLVRWDVCGIWSSG